MQEEKSARRSYVDLRGQRHVLTYRLWSEEGRYAVSVCDRNGESAAVRDVTTIPARSEAFFALVVRNLVTPVTLRDVAEDFLS